MADFPTRRLAITETVDMLETLTGYYKTPEECVRWFRLPQPLLDNMTPIDLITEGRAGDIRRVFEAMDAGVYL